MSYLITGFICLIIGIGLGIWLSVKLHNAPIVDKAKKISEALKDK